MRKKTWLDFKLEQADKQELEEISEKVDDKLFGEVKDTTRTELAHIGHNPEEAAEFIKHWGKFHGLSTGFKSVDSLTYGWEPGELIIMGGEPGIGKSAFIVNLAINVAKQNVIPTIVTLELTSAQLKSRTARAYGNGWEELPILYQKVQFITKKDFPDIVENAVKQGSEFIIVDYLQMLNEDTENEHIAVAQTIRELKLLALKHNIVILSISALNRNRDSEAGLQMKDLHGSGKIEYYADQVIFLEKGVTRNEINVKIVKNRSNPIDFENNKKHLNFDGAKFSDPLGPAEELTEEQKILKIFKD